MASEFDPNLGQTNSRILVWQSGAIDAKCLLDTSGHPTHHLDIP